MKRRRDELYRHDIDFPLSMSICPVCGTSVSKEDIGIHVEDHFTQPSTSDESDGLGCLEVSGISNSTEYRTCNYGKCQQMDDRAKQSCLEGQAVVTGTEFIPFSTSDWDDHIFGHTLEGDNISSNSTGNSILTTFQQQQQEQYDVPPLVYSQNDQALAQELEKQEMERLENQPCEWDDHMLAQALESEQRREFEEQRKQEEEEYKKLQAMYGMSSSSGYATQYSRQLEKDVSRNKTSVGDYYARKAEMLKILMTDNDSGESCTRGIIPQLHHRYDMGVSGTKSSWLAIDTDHYASTVGDAGWGCGYRNLQMLISSLLKMDIYKPVMLNAVGEKVPSIPRIQQFIEAAWTNGFDKQGAEQLGCKLVNTRKWIGATEIAALFRSLQIRAKIIDFHQATGCDGTHPEMFSWIKRYFSCSVNSSVLPMGSSVLRQTSVPPLYLQHQGHSRLVIGIEEHSGKDGGLYLLLFDPSHSAKQMQGLVEDIQSSSSGLRHLRRSLKQMRCKQYQIVYVDGIMEPTEMEQGKILDSLRVP
ncbi:zinc finger-containing ubiquitin peptidase 1-like isoform X1 [Acropora palmata]|uniref:zinc finger-containing ubiquitin peptidase 1-like isoform X1 n=1 Tax=Acropora palmata TaxID=6131 RepID=UPI003DA00130